MPIDVIVYLVGLLLAVSLAVAAGAGVAVLLVHASRGSQRARRSEKEARRR